MCELNMKCNCVPKRSIDIEKHIFIYDVIEFAIKRLHLM